MNRHSRHIAIAVIVALILAVVATVAARAGPALSDGSRVAASGCALRVQARDPCDET